MNEGSDDSRARGGDQAAADEYVKNQSSRILELGRQLDRQLNLWLTFAALTVLLALGVTEEPEYAGMKIHPDIGAAITYGLSCAFYYRAQLSGAALGILKESLNKRRFPDGSDSFQGAKGQSSVAPSRALIDVEGNIPEFPGYVASSVLLKLEADRRGGLLGTYIAVLYYGTIAAFVMVPCVLAVVIWQVNPAPVFFIVACAGLLLAMLGNGLTVFRFLRRRGSADSDAAE